jgi:hypothetical protein
MLLPGEIKARVLPLVRLLPPQSPNWHGAEPAAESTSAEEQLNTILEGRETVQDVWALACALYTAGKLRPDGYWTAIAKYRDAPEPLLRETASRVLVQNEMNAPTDSGPSRGPIGSPMHTLSTIEKVIILKAVRPFAETPDRILAEVAALVEEVQVPAGAKLFDKGDVGDSMYIIVSGRVRIHDGDHTLNELGPRDVLGEMTLLDREPRTASATAIDDGYVLRLRHEPFLELMADRIEVVHGIVRSVAGHLRATSAEVARLSASV